MLFLKHPVGNQIWTVAKISTIIKNIESSKVKLKQDLLQKKTNRYLGAAEYGAERRMGELTADCSTFCNQNTGSQLDKQTNMVIVKFYFSIVFLQNVWPNPLKLGDSSILLQSCYFDVKNTILAK